MKLLYDYAKGVGAIFFPPGKPKDGGTCFFATRKCLKWCEAGPPNPIQRAIYKHVVSSEAVDVAAQIVRELTELDANFLFWFAGGDCLPTDEPQILDIMEAVRDIDSGIIQHGFTRNRGFADSAIDLDVSMVVTMENEKKAKADKSGHVLAVPCYPQGIVKLYKRGVHMGSCGHYYMTDMKAVAMENHCSVCHEHNVGCFEEGD